MKKLLLWIFFIPIPVIILFSLSCGSNFEQVELEREGVEQVEIIVSKITKESIEAAAPEREYCFYALRESCPKNVTEMHNARLFICGEVKENAGLNVIDASLDDLGAPLFNSIHENNIDPNAVSGSMKQSQTVSVTLENGEVAEILHECSFYGTDKSIEDLVSICVEEMKKGNNNVLLVSRDIKNDVLNKMVEIVFKKQ